MANISEISENIVNEICNYLNYYTEEDDDTINCHKAILVDIVFSILTNNNLGE